MWHACKRRERQHGFGSRPDRMRPHKIPKHIQKGNFIMDLVGIGYEGVECISLVQGRDWCGAVVNTIIILDIP
jgi:hypothetical protein